MSNMILPFNSRTTLIDLFNSICFLELNKHTKCHFSLNYMFKYRYQKTNAGSFFVSLSEVINGCILISLCFYQERSNNYKVSTTSNLHSLVLS